MRQLCALATLALCAPAACAPMDRDPKWRAAGNATPRDGGTLRIAIPEVINSLDPTFNNDEFTTMATHALFATLVAFAPASQDDPRAGLQIVPALAERWELSPDALVYTFTLRAGLVYSDGSPVFAADIRGALEHQLRTPGAPAASLLGDIAGAAAVTAGTAPHASGLEVRDARTLAIHLSRPNAGFLGVLTMQFTTPQPEGRTPDRSEPLGTGPFVLAAWAEGERMTLRRNPRYWDAAHIHLDAIEIAENVPAEVEFLEFERGELDAAARLAAPDDLWIRAQPAWAPDLRWCTVMATFGARMNVRVKPFDDRRVRQAINYAFDKTHLLKLLLGEATIAHGPLPPGMLGRDDTLAPYPHDPAKARALLAEAGYPNGFDTDYLVPAAASDQQVAVLVQSDLAEVGIRVHVRTVAFPTWITELTSATGAPFAETSWLFDYPDPSNVFDAAFLSRAIRDDESSNAAFYANPALDALIDAARAEPDPEARAALYRRADQIVHDDAPWLWTYHARVMEVVQPYVAGYATHPVWLRDYTHAWLDVGPDGRPVPR
jgi:ABC-type transport system substrate-binding protein